MKESDKKENLKKFIGNSEGVEIVDLPQDNEAIKEIVKSYVSDKRNKQNVK